MVLQWLYESAVSPELEAHVAADTVTTHRSYYRIPVHAGFGGIQYETSPSRLDSRFNHIVWVGCRSRQQHRSVLHTRFVELRNRQFGELFESRKLRRDDELRTEIVDKRRLRPRIGDKSRLRKVVRRPIVMLLNIPYISTGVCAFLTV